MANPDTNKLVVNSLATAFPVAILFLLITVTLFQFRDSIGAFKLVLWLGFPIITFIIAFGANMVSQYITCKTTNAGKALLGGIPSIIAVLIGLGISSISYCRIPVTSVFAPLIIGKSIDVTKNKAPGSVNSLKNMISKECCVPKLTLDNVESQYPIVAGLSYGFYIMFSILFGMVIGTGLSSIC